MNIKRTPSGINQTGELIVRMPDGKEKKSMPERYQLEVFMGMYDEKKWCFAAPIHMKKNII